MAVSISGDGAVTGVASINTDVSSTELGYLDGVSSAIQTQINANSLSFAKDYVATQETTTGTSYANLATVGPSVTLTTGTSALVIITAGIYNSVSGWTSLMSFDVSGATTIAASDTYSLQIGDLGTRHMSSAVYLLTNLNAGSNTFTTKYKVAGGSSIGYYKDRYIVVIGLGS